MEGITLIAIIAVMGGIIAYVGDKLGSKIGKKRISVFDLRPKHTSILMTIVTGMLIAALTIASMSYLSNDVRTALFGMERLKTDLRQLADNVQVKNKEIEFTQELLQEKNKALLQVDATITALETEKIQMETDLTKAKDTVLQVEKQLQEAVIMKSGLQAEIEQLDKTAERLREGLINVREGQIIYRAGEVVNSGVLKAEGNDSVNQAELGRFLNNVNTELINKFGVTNKTLQLIYLPEDASREILNKMRQLKGQQVNVRLLAVGNLVYGDPVLVKAEVLPNTKIYARGETIYSKLIDMRGKNAQEALVRILGEINAEAVAKGVMPDPLTGTVGNLSIGEIVNLSNEIQKYKNSTIQVLVTAKTDIYVSDLLTIDMEINKAQ